MTTPINPNSKAPAASSEQAEMAQAANPLNVSGGFASRPMTFLGMHFDAEEAKKLWIAIMATISHQIEHEKQRALEALRKLRHPG